MTKEHYYPIINIMSSERQHNQEVTRSEKNRIIGEKLAKKYGLNSVTSIVFFLNNLLVREGIRDDDKQDILLSYSRTCGEKLIRCILESKGVNQYVLSDKLSQIIEEVGISYMALTLNSFDLVERISQHLSEPNNFMYLLPVSHSKATLEQQFSDPYTLAYTRIAIPNVENLVPNQELLETLNQVFDSEVDALLRFSQEVTQVLRQNSIILKQYSILSE